MYRQIASIKSDRSADLRNHKQSTHYGKTKKQAHGPSGPQTNPVGLDERWGRPLPQDFPGQARRRPTVAASVHIWRAETRDGPWRSGQGNSRPRARLPRPAHKTIEGWR